MKKLIRYHSFEALKSSTKPANTLSTKSKERLEQMGDFMKLLRHRWLEEKKSQKKNLETSNRHE